MIKKIIGTILTLIGGALIVMLLTYGGPVFPHIIGPGIVTVLGILLLAIKGQANKTTE